MQRRLQDIEIIAKKAGFDKSDIFCYGNHIAKVNHKLGKKQGKLVLVTAMTSNKTGIGKTTISIGLADALNMLGKKAMLALREPSLGPVFGIKGGATGGGKSSIEPSEEINLHFTGDFHAVTEATNLLASIVDNHIYQGNALDLDTDKIMVRRCLDVNDRSLREIVYSIKGKKVKTGFDITSASEIMAIMCLSKNLSDLKYRLGNIMVGRDFKNQPVYAKDLKAEDSLAILLKDALKPNLVQSLSGTPALVHMGPFANIAHGCNSVIATTLALTHSQYTITEAGFGSDLGGEKFCDITSRVLSKLPDGCVLVVTISAIKEHGQGDIAKGFENVKKHISNMRDVFGLPVVVAINKHKDDKAQELWQVEKCLIEEKTPYAVATPFEKGGNGCKDLAVLVEKICSQKKNFCYVWDWKDDIKTRVEKIATKIYGAKTVKFSPLAKRKLEEAEKHPDYFVNIAKTQSSLSDDKNLLGAPSGFDFHISDLQIRHGAKMIVFVAGDMFLMPGLGKNSNYQNMKIDKNGKTKGIK